MKRTIEILLRLVAPPARLVALLLAVCAAGGAWAIDASITVDGTSVTVHNDNGSSFDNAGISSMGGYQNTTITIPSSTDLATGTFILVETISIGESTSQSGNLPAKISVASTDGRTCVSTSKTVTSGGFSVSSCNKDTYSFAGQGCILKVGTAAAIKWLNSDGSEFQGLAAFRLVNSGYQFISRIAWSGKVPVVEVTGKIVQLITGATTGIKNTDSAKPLYLINATGWMATDNASTGEIVLVDGSNGYALGVNNANSVSSSSDQHTTWPKLSGTGTLTVLANNTGGTYPVLEVWDSSDFEGSIVIGGVSGAPNLGVLFCNENEALPKTRYAMFRQLETSQIYITSGRTAANNAAVTIPAGKTWRANGLKNYGELIVDGTFSGDIVNTGILTVNGNVTGAISGSGTLTVNGTVNGEISCSGGVAVNAGTVTVGSGTTLTKVAAGAEVLVNGGAPANLEAAIAGGYELSATLTVPETVDGTITFVDSNGNAADNAASTYENGVRSYTGTAPANPTYTGSAWWWDYEFDEDYGVNYTSGGVTYRYSMPNTGSADTTKMSLESLSNAMYTDADATGNREIYFQQTPWRDASFNSLTEMTAVMYCQPGNYANTVLVGFGSTTASGKTAIALVTGDNPANGDMKLVLVAGDSQTVTSLATLKAVDATTKKHLYAFVMDRITEDETVKTRVRVYLDGKVKAIYKHSGTLALSNGFQIGSLHGGVGNSGFSKYTASGNSGTLDFLRVFNGSLSDSAMAALADAYKYESAHGEATRDAVSAAASWVATDVWTQTVPEQADAVQDAPNADTNVTLSKGGSSDVAVELNLESDSNYESLTLTKEVGASGALKIVSSHINQTSGKLVAAATSILVDTVIPAGRANLGITSIGDGVTLTVDPFSGVGNCAILSKLVQLAPGETFEDIVISMAILGEGASVVLDSTGVSALEAAGFTATLTHNESNQSYTFSITRSAEVDVDIVINDVGTTWIANEVAMPAQTEMPSTYTGTVTIYNRTDNPATVDASFAGGNLTVAASLTELGNTYPTSPVVLTGTISTSGTVTFDGAVTLGGTAQTVSSAVTGSGVVTVNGSVTVASTGSIANTIAGSGTLTFEALPASALSFGNWTGTVWLKNISSGNIVPANYGNANSTIRFTGVTGTIAQDETFTPAVELVDEGDTKALTIDCTTGYAANTATFSAIKGSGTFVTSSSNDQDPRTTFKVLDWSNFTGALNIDRGRLVFGTDTISADSWRYIYVSAGVNVTIASGKTWNATDGVVVKGTLNMPSTASMTVNKYSGDGTVNITGTPANDPSLTFSSWTGTFVLPDFTSNDKFNLIAYGTSGSWIKLNDFSPGWLKVGTLSISANLLLEGDFILTAMNGGSAFSFQTVSGSGNISLTSSAAPASITIANLAEFTGSIANSSGASLVITKRTLAEAPSVDDCILVSSTPDNVSVEGVYVGETQQDVILEKKTDGIYVAATKSTETVDNETVTVLDTGSNTEIDATGVSGKVAIPGTVTQISGVAAADLLLKVTYTPDGGDSTTGYYAGILTLDNSGNVSLNPSGTVAIADETVKVQPETAEDSPMTFTGSSPSFTVKAIPGLWYQVVTGTSMSGTELAGTKEAGTAVQATTTTVSPAAPVFTGTVKFYKIAVGASQAALQ